MTDKILTSIDGAIGRIVFNQPEKRNAVSLSNFEMSAPDTKALPPAPDRMTTRTFSSAA